MANDVLKLQPPRAALHADDFGDPTKLRFFSGLPQAPASLAASVTQSPRHEDGLYADGRLEPPIYMFITAVRDEFGSHDQTQYSGHAVLCDLEERTEFLKNCESIAMLIAEFVLVEGLLED